MNRTKTILLLAVFVIGLTPLLAYHDVCIVVHYSLGIGPNNCTVKARITNNAQETRNDPFVNGPHQSLSCSTLHNYGDNPMVYGSVTVGNYTWSSSTPYTNESPTYLHIYCTWPQLPDTGDEPETP